MVYGNHNILYIYIHILDTHTMSHIFLTFSYKTKQALRTTHTIIIIIIRLANTINSSMYINVFKS